MARLLVVSRSMALAMRLADAHEVIEHPVEDIDHLMPPPGVDVVVLDVGEPAAAIHALDRLRAGGHETPALIVSGYQPAWASLVAIDVPDVVVVPLPITRAALLGGIAELCRAAAERSRQLGQAAPTSTSAPGLYPAVTVPVAAAPAEPAAGRNSLWDAPTESTPAPTAPISTEQISAMLRAAVAAEAVAKARVSDPVERHVPEPVMEQVPDPVVEQVPEPVVEQVPEPVAVRVAPLQVVAPAAAQATMGPVPFIPPVPLSPRPTSNGFAPVNGASNGLAPVVMPPPLPVEAAPPPEEFEQPEDLGSIWPDDPTEAPAPGQDPTDHEDDDPRLGPEDDEPRLGWDDLVAPDRAPSADGPTPGSNRPLKPAAFLRRVVHPLAGAGAAAGEAGSPDHAMPAAAPAPARAMTDLAAAETELAAVTPSPASAAPRLGPGVWTSPVDRPVFAPEPVEPVHPVDPEPVESVVPLDPPEPVEEPAAAEQAVFGTESPRPFPPEFRAQVTPAWMRPEPTRAAGGNGEIGVIVHPVPDLSIARHPDRLSVDGGPRAIEPVDAALFQPVPEPPSAARSVPGHADVHDASPDGAPHEAEVDDAAPADAQQDAALADTEQSDGAEPADAEVANAEFDAAEQAGTAELVEPQHADLQHAVNAAAPVDAVETLAAAPDMVEGSAVETDAAEADADAARFFNAGAETVPAPEAVRETDATDLDTTLDHGWAAQDFDWWRPLGASDAPYPAEDLNRSDPVDVSTVDLRQGEDDVETADPAQEWQRTPAHGLVELDAVPPVAVALDPEPVAPVEYHAVPVDPTPIVAISDQAPVPLPEPDDIDALRPDHEFAPVTESLDAPALSQAVALADATAAQRDDVEPANVEAEHVRAQDVEADDVEAQDVEAQDVEAQDVEPEYLETGLVDPEPTEPELAESPLAAAPQAEPDPAAEAVTGALDEVTGPVDADADAESPQEQPADVDVHNDDLADQAEPALPPWGSPAEATRPTMIFDRPPAAWRPQTTVSEQLAAPAPTTDDEADLAMAPAASLEDVAASIARRRAILGRPEHSPGGSALSKRLAGRAFETSLGPGGSSAELVALGLRSSVDDGRSGRPASPDPYREPAARQQPAWEEPSWQQGWQEPAWEQSVPGPSPTVPSVPVGPMAPVAPNALVAPVGPATPPSEPRPAAPHPVEPTYTAPVRPAASPSSGYSPLSALPYAAGAGGSFDEPEPEVEPVAAAPDRHTAVALVAALTEQIGQVYGVADTAQVLADEVVERADADAAAILVPDGTVWRVSGGVGLRPLERRLVLDATHWLVGEIAIEGRALLVEDTDIVRPKLVGAPLAAWRHLLAVPVPNVQAAVVLARGHEAGPFTEHDLAIIVGPVREAAALLQAAIQARHLARLLSPLREQEPGSQ